MRATIPLLSLVVLGSLSAPSAAADKDDVIKVVTDAYVNGVHVKPDAAAMRRGFHPDFRMLVLTDGRMSAVTLDEWAGRIEKAAASGKAPTYVIKHAIPQVDIMGTAATVKVELWRDGAHTFTDFLSLYKFADGWKIVGKTFYSHPRAGTQ
jgi:hypothetical protein